MTASSNVSNLLKQFLDEESDDNTLPYESQRQYSKQVENSHWQHSEQAESSRLQEGKQPDTSRWQSGEESYRPMDELYDSHSSTPPEPIHRPDKNRGTSQAPRVYPSSAASDPFALSLDQSLQRDYLECTGAERKAAKQLEAAGGIAPSLRSNDENGRRLDGNVPGPHRKHVAKANKNGKKKRAFPPTGPQPPQVRIYHKGMAFVRQHQKFIQSERQHKAHIELTHKPTISERSQELAQEMMHRPGEEAQHQSLPERLINFKGVLEDKKQAAREKLASIRQEEVESSRPPPSHGGLIRNGAEACEYLYHEGVERKYRREQLHEQSFAALSFQPRLTDATQDIIKRKKDESRQEPLAVAGGLAEGAESRQETYRKNIFGDECTFKPKISGESLRLAEDKRRKDQELEQERAKKEEDTIRDLLPKLHSEKSGKSVTPKPRFSTSKTTKTKRRSSLKLTSAASKKAGSLKGGQKANSKDRNHWLHAEAAVKAQQRAQLKEQGEVTVMEACTFVPKTLDYMYNAKDGSVDEGVDGGVCGDWKVADRMAKWQSERNERVQEQREAKKDHDLQETTFKPSLGESTASFLRVQKTWQQPVEIDAFPTRKRMSVSQFVERQKSGREMKSQQAEVSHVTGENWTKRRTTPQPFSFEKRDALLKSSKSSGDLNHAKVTTPRSGRHGGVPDYFLNFDPVSTPPPQPKSIIPSTLEKSTRESTYLSPTRSSRSLSPSLPSPVSPLSPPPERIQQRPKSSPKHRATAARPSHSSKHRTASHSSRRPGWVSPNSAKISSKLTHDTSSHYSARSLNHHPTERPSSRISPVDRSSRRSRIDGVDLDPASPMSPRYNDAELQRTWTELMALAETELPKR